MNRRDALAGLAAAAAGLSSTAWVDVQEPIRTRGIPNTSEALPVIGLGTWQTFDVREDRWPQLREVVKTFAQLGGRVIDSSPMYGRAEEATGAVTDALELNDRLFLASKVWTRGEAAGVREMERTLSLMKRRRLDLMQVHNLLDVDTHLDTLAEWKQAGRVRYIGITHYTSGAYASIERLLERDTRIDFLQVNYSLAERDAERRILPLAAERGIAVLINRPFAEGALFRRVRDRPLPSWAREIDCTAWSQVFLKFIISHPAVTCAIPATSNVAHLRENLLAGRGRLPDAELRQRIADTIGG